MTRAEFNTWLAALRSGEYEQGKCGLRRLGDKFCCLGVYLDAVEKQKRNIDWVLDETGDYTFLSKTSVLPNDIWEQSFYSPKGDGRIEGRTALANFNDRCTPFNEIADILEQCPEDYVKFTDEETPT